MSMHLEVLFTPSEFTALPQRDLSGMVCVVFDILRATSTMMTALANGARAIIPVADIPEALAVSARHPGALLAGERHGFRIGAEQTGGRGFDLGNSPREFTPDTVRDKTIITTTTNGTRALRAVAKAKEVWIGSFSGLSALSGYLWKSRPEKLLLVCSGTEEEASYEDTLAAGALCSKVWSLYSGGQLADSAQMARQIFVAHEHDLIEAMQYARNGRRLLSIPELKDDVAFCLQIDRYDFIVEMDREGMITRSLRC